MKNKQQPFSTKSTTVTSNTDKTLAERKALIAELMAQDRAKLLIKMPFIGGLLMRLDLVPVRDYRLDTASTDGDSIYADIDFYGSLDADERLFVLAHEAWHCALLHFVRRQNRKHRIFNIAADLEIHFVLTDSGLKAPFVLPHDPKWNGLSAEEIYERILELDNTAEQTNCTTSSQCPNGKSASSRGQNSGHLHRRDDGQGFDRHLDKNDSISNDNTEKTAGREGIGEDPDYKPGFASGVAERCRERLASAAQQYERTRGTLPGNLAGLLESILKPEIDWRELLAQFVTNCYGGSRRWLPPARRHVWQGLYLQSQRQERLRATVAIDTSGSTWRDLPVFFSELISLLNSFGGYELTVIQCDAKVQSVERFDDSTQIDPNRKWKAGGFGGTDFRPVFEYIEKHPETDPNLLIYFTDGYGPAPDRAPSYPVMWLLTKDGKEPCYWGSVARFREKRE